MNDLGAFTGGFTDLGQVGPVRFQGGVIFLQGYGCPSCGNGFWTEADSERRLDRRRDACRCPHCGDAHSPLLAAAPPSRKRRDDAPSRKGRS